MAKIENMAIKMTCRFCGNSFWKRKKPKNHRSLSPIFKRIRNCNSVTCSKICAKYHRWKTQNSSTRFRRPSL